MKTQKLLLTLASAVIFTACSNSSPIKKTLTVTFDSNGGTEVASQTITEDSTINKPEDPLRRPYAFGGWYLDNSFAKPFDFATPITSDTTLYAKWNENIQFTYTYHDEFSYENRVGFMLNYLTFDELTSEFYDLTINWGDGATEIVHPGEYGTEFYHDYNKGTSGVTQYHITILGIVNGIQFNNDNDGGSYVLDCEGNNFIQSIRVNQLMYHEIDYSMRLGGISNLTSEVSQVSDIIIPNDLTTISNYAFAATSIKKFTISDKITRIGTAAFLDIATLEQINLENAKSLYMIEDVAFNGCGKLESVIFPENVATIGSAAFARCSKLKKVTFTSFMPPFISEDTFDVASTSKDEKSKVGGVEVIYVPKGRKSAYINQWRNAPADLLGKIVEVD